MLTPNEASFSINIEGESTGERYVGSFKCKVRLSMRDNIVKDNIRRQLLSNNPTEADGLAADLATAAGELAVRILDAPPWWKASDNGLDLEDTSVLVEVFNQARRLEREAREKLEKKAEEAQPELKKKLEEEKG